MTKIEKEVLRLRSEKKTLKRIVMIQGVAIQDILSWIEEHERKGWKMSNILTRIKGKCENVQTKIACRIADGNERCEPIKSKKQKRL